MPPFESAVLFTPGRASYVTTAPDGSFQLNLTESSANRGEVARGTFDPGFHTTALFAGGYPAVENWPAEHIPPLGEREADLMARSLEDGLLLAGWAAEAIGERVLIQGESSDSIGDVAASIQKGFLDPNDFHNEQTVHGIDLNTGFLHGLRFKMILKAALDLNSGLINQLPTRDTYGTPATEFQKAQGRLGAVAKEMVGIGLTKRVLKGVVPGDLDSLIDAQEKLNQTIAKLAGNE